MSHDLTMATTRKQPLSNGSDIILFGDLSLFGEDRTLLSNTFCEACGHFKNEEVMRFHRLTEWRTEQIDLGSDLVQ